MRKEWLSRLRFFFLLAFEKNKRQRELDEELQFHLEQAIAGEHGRGDDADRGAAAGAG